MDIINIADKETLNKLRNDLLKEDINPSEILDRYYDKYHNYRIIKCNVHFGNMRNIGNFKRDIDNIVPYSKIQNYNRIRQIRGFWRDIYSIAFNTSPVTEVVISIPKEEKNKQMKIEA